MAAIEAVARAKDKSFQAPQGRESDERYADDKHNQGERQPKNQWAEDDRMCHSSRSLCRVLYAIQPSSRALSLASFQAFPTNDACEIGDR